jgi:hypothetical protein
MVTNTWSSGTGSGDFLAGANWSLGTAPAAGETALIGFGQPNLVNATIDGFTIDIVSAQTLTATLGMADSTLGSGIVLTDTGSSNGQSMIATGTVTSNGTMLFDAPVGGLFNGFSLDMQNPGDQFVNNGVIDVFNGDGLFVGNGSGGTLVNNGTVAESGGRLVFNSRVSGTGTIIVNGVALAGAPAADFEAPVGNGETLIFGPTASSVTIDPNVLTHGTDFGATVLGFVQGDTFDFSNSNFSDGTYDTGTRVLEIRTLTGTIDIHFGGSLPYTAATFTRASAGGGFLVGTTVVACFAAGTRISTARGRIRVEALVEGDRATTQSGMHRRVIWTGRRHINCREHPLPESVYPVRIRAGAFGDDIPIRDLHLSPDHSVFVDGVLTPIRYLINGSTIVQIAVDEVTYYHLELDRHEVILAEGLACESYLDTGNRAAFEHDRWLANGPRASSR